jgi:oligoendopeptidase F
MEILHEFSSKSIDWSGLDEFRSAAWQRQLHLFEVPFYYIEYGIAQLGAIGMWKQYKENKEAAVNNYITALSLGGTRTLPELYEAAGLRFDLSEAHIRHLMDFVEVELMKIIEH